MGTVVYYYKLQNDALNFPSSFITFSNSYTLISDSSTGSTFNNWTVAVNSTGSSSGTFSAGQTLAGTGSEVYYVFVAAVPGIVYYYPNAESAYAKDYTVQTNVTDLGNAALNSYNISNSSICDTIYFGSIVKSSPRPPFDQGPYYAFLYQRGICVYYDSLANALNYPSLVGRYSQTSANQVVPVNNINSWIVSSNSFRLSDLTVIGNTYTVNTILPLPLASTPPPTPTPPGFYIFYQAAGPTPEPVPCFAEGSEILCYENEIEVYKKIETLKPGHLVKTLNDDYKAIALIGYSNLQNNNSNERIKDKMYKLSRDKYHELTNDLYLTGCHSILVPDITEEQRMLIIEKFNRVFITDNKYRLMTCIDERSEPVNDDNSYRVWHFALESEDDNRNYGVWANGLLVETTFIKQFKNRNNVSFIQ